MDLLLHTEKNWDNFAICISKRFFKDFHPFRESKSANISMAEAKRKAIINGRVRRLSDQVDHVKKTVQENSEHKKSRAEQTIKKMNTRLQNAECKRSRRLNSISVRCVHLDHTFLKI